MQQWYGTVRLARGSQDSDDVSASKNGPGIAAALRDLQVLPKY